MRPPFTQIGLVVNEKLLLTRTVDDIPSILVCIPPFFANIMGNYALQSFFVSRNRLSTLQGGVPKMSLKTKSQSWLTSTDKP
jgi:hypothetical protein